MPFRFVAVPLCVAVLLTCIACIAVGRAASADDAETEPPIKDSLDRDYSGELPRIKPTEPADALATFELRPGFRIEQVAAEPLVTDPVAVAFDEDGRLYVVEMRGYSEDPDDNLGRVRLLEDTDGDGRFDKSTVFADGLSWPTAIACSRGGVYIGAAPDIIYCKDTDGDRKADVRRKVYTGFGRGNVQGLLNTFKWGLDNRIHGATSSSGADVRPAEDPDAKPLSLHGRDFAFDPLSERIEAESGGAQHGLSFDMWGRKFVCSNSDHIQQVMFLDRYVARNPYLAAPGSRRSIASDGPQAEVYRISPVEPWRIVRTRLRVQSIVKGPVEGGGRAAGYFTGSTGVTIYRGNAWPEEFVGNAIIGDVGSNIVHRKVIATDGIQFRADRSEPEVEFIASKDIWFRPVQFANAPDGALYIVDMYREVIEHPLSLPEIIKKHLDLTSGRDRGRIYRVVPDGFQQPSIPRLGEADTNQLVATLAHPNGWHRETAARLLYERQDLAAIKPLRALATGSASPVGRVHALYALDGLNALTPEVILTGLRAEHPRLREHAVRLAERVAGDSADVRAKLYSMVDDPDVRVRYQLAFTLGEIDAPGRNPALIEIARRDAADPWIRLAIQSSLSEGAGEVFGRLAADHEFRASDAGKLFLASLAEQIGAKNRKDELAAVLSGIEQFRGDESGLAQAIVHGLTKGLEKSGNKLSDSLASTDGAKLGGILDEMLNNARRAATDQTRDVGDRVEAIGALPLGNFETARDVLAELLDNRQPQAIQTAALSALARFNQPDVARLVIEAWAGFSPRMRMQASETLFARPAWLDSLLNSIEAGDVAPRDLEPARIRMLLAHPDAALRSRAEQLVGGDQLARRQDVVDAYRAALEISGVATRGKEVYKKVCAACHRVEGVGQEIGPNLATIQNRGAEAILLNVLDPNREVNPQYVNYTLITTDGRSITGMIGAETATSVTLVRAENAKDTVLRINIDQLQATGLSLMPEGMEKDIDQQAMADLIAYLTSLN